MAVAHYSLLISVHSDPGLTGAEVARRLNVTPQAVASLADRLESRRQLERRAHPRHRHVQELYLTDEGREVLRRADAVVAEVEANIAQQLGQANTTRLRALLEKVAAAAQNGVNYLESRCGGGDCRGEARQHGQRHNAPRVVEAAPLGAHLRGTVGDLAL